MRGSGQSQHFTTDDGLCASDGPVAVQFDAHLHAGRAAGTGDLAHDDWAASLRRDDDARIRELEAQLEAQASRIREQEASLAHSRRIFERASYAARIGVWECSLADETLCWTDGTYDLFDVPRGSLVDRQRIVKCYTKESAEALQQLRSKAIKDGTGFTLDAEIVTLKGRHRWIRLTATVEYEDGLAVRIFGIKQDITEEKLLWERTRYLAEFDSMTGLANRSQFQSKLSQMCARGSNSDKGGTLLLLDLDGFKDVNDTFGHACGDDCLKEAASRLAGVCSDAELVARIGGDEFAVLFSDRLCSREIENMAGEIVRAMSWPISFGGHDIKLGASIGIARCAASTAPDLFREADAALYAAKAAGRNTFRIFRAHMTQSKSALATSDQIRLTANG